MIADSTMELYQAKLMVLHAAYRIDHGLDFKSEVSMAKHFINNMLGRVIDRSIQVHGALGYSPTPLAGMPMPGGHGSPTAPTRSIRCALRSERSTLPRSRFARPPPAICRCSRPYRHGQPGGSSTSSMTWMMPLLASTSPEEISFPLMNTLSPSRVTVRSVPATVVSVPG